MQLSSSAAIIYGFYMLQKDRRVKLYIDTQFNFVQQVEDTLVSGIKASKMNDTVQFSLTNWWEL